MRDAEVLAGRIWGFSLYDLPLLALLPLLGAALGLVAFAVRIGGFLVASGSRAPSYSPAGLLFVAALAGCSHPTSSQPSRAQPTRFSGLQVQPRLLSDRLLAKRSWSPLGATSSGAEGVRCVELSVVRIANALGRSVARTSGEGVEARC